MLTVLGLRAQPILVISHLPAKYRGGCTGEPDIIYSLGKLPGGLIRVVTCLIKYLRHHQLKSGTRGEHSAQARWFDRALQTTASITR